jgi:ribosome maturation factor RimP
VSATRGTRKPDPATARLAGWIEPVVGAAGYDLEELVVTPAGRRSVVRVVVDRDRGVTLDEIAEVSRALSAALDDSDAMGSGPYVLEVTSPGVDRPLTQVRQWRRAVGRLVAVALRDGGRTTGRVVAATDEGVLLDDGTGRVMLGYEAISRGIVQVEFDRAGSAHGGPAGEDEEAPA